MKAEIDTGNTKGIKRDLDELGRVVIPMEIRKEFNSKTVEIYTLERGVYLEFVD